MLLSLRGALSVVGLLLFEHVVSSGPGYGDLTPLNRKLIFCYLEAQMLEELNMRRGIMLSLRRLKAVWGRLQPVGFLFTHDHRQGRPC